MKVHTPQPEEPKPAQRKRRIVYLLIPLAVVIALLFSVFNPFYLFGNVEYFPVKTEPANASMLLSVQGELIIQNGYIRIVPFAFGVVPYPIKTYLLLWPNGYSWQKSGPRVEILDGNGQVVARIGDIVNLAGGEWPESTVNTAFYPHLPEDNLGPFWVVGSII